MFNSIDRFPIHDHLLVEKVFSMEKIVIISCNKIMDNCSGKGCKQAFKKRQDAFSNYPLTQVKLVGFIKCRHCDETAASHVPKKTDRLLRKGVQSIHLSSCIASVCEQHDVLVEALSKQFIIVSGTHLTGKSNY